MNLKRVLVGGQQLLIDADTGSLIVWAQVLGGVLSSVKAKDTTPVTVEVADAGATFTNEGASEKIVFNLPSAEPGLSYDFIVQDSDGVRIKGGAGDRIRLDDTVTIAAGYVESVQVGAAVHLIAINATEWVATGFVGVWDLETS